MDASASPEPDSNIVYGFFIKAKDSNTFAPLNKNNTVIKFTKLPDFDLDGKVSQPAPRLRHIIEIDVDDVKTNRSVRSKVSDYRSDNKNAIAIANNYEYVPIRERTNRTTKRINTLQQDKPSLPNRTSARISSPSKHMNIKESAKSNSAYNKREVNQSNYNRRREGSVRFSENTKVKQAKERVSYNSKSPHAARSSISKYGIAAQNNEHEEISQLRNILYENLKTNFPNKKPVKKGQTQPSTVQKNKKHPVEDILSATKAPSIITIPCQGKYFKPRLRDNISTEAEVLTINMQEAHVGTDALTSVDKVTEMDDFQIYNNTLSKCESVQTNNVNILFDSLEIPNVTLTKEKSQLRGDSAIIDSLLSNIPVVETPPINHIDISANKEEVSSNDVSFCQSTSIVVSRSTVTYTSRQKINVHVLDEVAEVSSKKPPSPLDYPITVMSVFKNELNNNVENVSETCKKKNNTREDCINCINELKSLNCSYVFNRLMKPSNIISAIKINNGLLQNDYICEQFQRELNFIDSFFDSLQYLESCSLSDKCISETKVDNLVNESVLFDSTFDVNNLEYDKFLTKLENGANFDDTETMASKSLCLLNLLIRDEQRRAKNLLFVLKMREDALKDFTKSQILWLEKKKKHDNTDISTLKKKQRGALLKLQHECGEMQRMRKALLALSEKRKGALMKTKKNIELKLKNNVDVQIILGKKKLKRTNSAERNVSPLKCFELSSSGCEESSTSKLNSVIALPSIEASTLEKVKSVEKCVQTGETLCLYPKSDSDVTAENFVAVDGSYLNILFNDLALPQIFNSGKHYEVNEEELKNIVDTTNNKIKSLDSEIVDKLIEQVHNRDVEISSPSTARSLVDEFDMYYRGLVDEDKSQSPPEMDSYNVEGIEEAEIKEVSIQADNNVVDVCVGKFKEVCNMSTMTNTSEEIKESVISVSKLDKECEIYACSLDVEAESITGVTSGPLPVPVGAAAEDISLTDISCAIDKSGSESEADIIQPQTSSSSLGLNSIPVQSEAEELRRQQLAIEREIKALEQQQCRLLVVREIPDKPPPPYTPPTEAKTKPPRMFSLDEDSISKIEKAITNFPLPVSSITPDNNDIFDEFLFDFCTESIERRNQELSDKPWDAYYLLPQKPQEDKQKLVESTAAEIKDVLSGATSATISGVSNRRSDHIDDILFTEWRRAEPEWTALHSDEILVKNKLFESIFQKILTETVDEYKKNVIKNEESE